MRQCDTAIIGGGIVGLATAMAMVEAGHPSLLVLEAEDRLAAHQSGRNSGVIHAGLYYRPGSLKARLCVEGREALYRFCAEHGIPCRRCGKVVVATSERELAALDALEQRGRANGLQGLRRLSPQQLREHEPHAAGIAGMHVAETGVVDYGAVTRAYAEVVRAAGGEVLVNARVRRVLDDGDGLVLETGQGAVRCRRLVNCAGLHADRVAARCGARPSCRIVPFRGEFWRIAPDRARLVRSLIYPVPDPRLPYLGVHLTRRIDDWVETGPNAVLTLNRHGYRRGRPSLGDALEVLGYRGFWRMAGRFWRTGVAEFGRSLSRRAFARQARRLVPDLTAADLQPAESGIRAQAVDPDGGLVDDFRIIATGRAIHVLNAPSPAATASISIGRYVAGMVLVGRPGH
ncbi:MAG: L-2-hydroxyglutarate oxidase [Planctomycetota bacterium]